MPALWSERFKISMATLVEISQVSTLSPVGEAAHADLKTKELPPIYFMQKVNGRVDLGA